ncbi:MAG: hypothetical protein PHT59_00470 [Candidatus Omnitrophica bacterium]|nr:hypothetical protein [Candidatus Omnitrophota bacterium]
MKRTARGTGIVLLVCFTIGACGCVTSKTARRSQVDELSLVTGLLVQKEEMIRQLEALVAEQERQLQEKDCQIQELKSRLKAFGVF